MFIDHRVTADFVSDSRSSGFHPHPTIINNFLSMQPIIPSLFQSHGAPLPLSHLELTCAAYHTTCNKAGERQEILHWFAYLCLKSLFLTEDRRAGNRRKNEVLAAGLEVLLAAWNLDSNGTVQYCNKYRLSSYDTDISYIGYYLSVSSLTGSYVLQKSHGSTCTSPADSGEED